MLISNVLIHSIWHVQVYVFTESLYVEVPVTVPDPMSGL